MLLFTLTPVLHFKNYKSELAFLTNPILFILCFLPALSRSQSYHPGYVIQHNGDTVFGFVKHPFGSPYGFVFKDSSGAKKDFPKESVTGYFTNSDGLYRNIVFEKDERLHMVKVITQGYLSYYELQLGTTTDSYYFIFEKKGQQEQCWYSADLFSGFKDKIIVYLSDDTALCDKIREGVYSKKDILHIVTEYNDFHHGE
jgi:hypothetical protein